MNIGELLAAFEPATRTAVLSSAPAVRKDICLKCPFGDNLSASEQLQADAIKARLCGQMSAGGSPTAWGCHETMDGQRPQICAGYAEWVRPRPELDA